MPPDTFNFYHGLIDTHVHLNEMTDVDQVISRAHAAGVGHIVAVGMDLVSNRKTLQLAEQYPDTVFPAIGYHPWRIQTTEIDETLSFIESHLSRCVALGEVGLDYKVKVKKPLQRMVFSRLLRLAKEKNRPVNIHSRFSHERTYQMVAEAGIEKAVFHWYSGPVDILERIIAHGYYVSATPALAYSRFHRVCIQNAPLERILIETDAPQEYQGTPSEPARLVDTLRLLSQLKKVSEPAAVRITVDNARRFYGITP